MSGPVSMYTTIRLYKNGVNWSSARAAAAAATAQLLNGYPDVGQHHPVRRIRARPNPSLEAFTRYVELLPDRLSVWTDGDAGLYPLLGWLNTHPVVEQRRLVEEGGPGAALRANVVHHNQVGQSVAWAFRFMRDPGVGGGSRETDRRALFELAGRYWTIQNLLAEVRQGIRGYEAEGRRVQLAYRGNRHMDALERLLGLVDEVMGIPDPADVAPDERLFAWVAEGGRDVPWERSPAWVHASHRRFADEMISRYPNYLPEELDVGGFTIRDALRLCSELLARAVHAQVATMYGSTATDAVVPRFPVQGLTRDLARSAGVAEGSASEIVRLLTFDPDRNPDPCLVPLIPVGDGHVLPMSSLIVPGSPLRNLTALLQDDPMRFGRAGQLLGALGARTVSTTLERLQGAQVATSVPVMRPDGTVAGDLDVVALDATEGLMAIFEVLWGIAPDGAAQVARAEARAHAKLDQVARLRGAINTGAIPHWPRGWSPTPEVRTRWFVLTPTVLPVADMPGDVVIRSHQLLARMLRRDTSVADLISLLDEPPRPPPELARTQWHRLRIGDYRVECETVMA